MLTVVTHELGHVLGFASIDPAIVADDWMTATLATGVRRLPDPLTPDASPQGNIAEGLTALSAPVLIGQERSPDLPTDDLFAFDFFATAPAELIVDEPAPPATAVSALLNQSVNDTGPSLAADDFDLAEPMPAGDGERVLVGGAGTELVRGDEGEMVLVGGFR